MFVPVYVTSPLTGFIRPSSVFINVVLPAPFAPSRQMILPVLNRRLMLLTIGEPLYPIERFVADITGIIHPSRKAGLKAKARMPCPQTRALQCRRYFTLQLPQTQQHVRQSHDGSSMLPRFAETIHRAKE